MCTSQPLCMLRLGLTVAQRHEQLLRPLRSSLASNLALDQLRSGLSKPSPMVSSPSGISGVDELAFEQLLGGEHAGVLLQLRQHRGGRLAVDGHPRRRLPPRLAQRARRVWLDSHLVDVLHVGRAVPARQGYTSGVVTEDFRVKAALVSYTG